MHASSTPSNLPHCNLGRWQQSTLQRRPQQQQHAATLPPPPPHLYSSHTLVRWYTLSTTVSALRRHTALYTVEA